MKQDNQDPRTLAIKTLVAVQNGKSLAQILHYYLEELAVKDRGFYHELVLGTLRHWFALVRISDNLAHQPITDEATLAAVHIGMYQLFYLRTPDHAAIGETVSAIKKTDSERASGLVNAVLRKCQKDFNKISKKINKNHSLPNWLAKQIKTDWKEYYNEVATNLRQPTHIFLRVNVRHISVLDYAKLLTDDEISFTLIEDVIRLDSRLNIEDLPHFEEGYVSVQDANAQKAIHLFSDLQNKNILDMCAAPGGKTAQILEKHDVSQIHAVDLEAMRTLRIADNLSRLGLLADNVHLMTADACKLSFIDITKNNPLQKQELFDAILLDAPCTATGVIRRHPDICLLRTEEDVEQTVHIQKAILENAWKLLKKGGELVYVTCSLLKAENCDQIAQFLENTPDAKEVPLDVEWGIVQKHGRQCLPIAVNEDTEFLGDGFYFAKIIKT